MIKHIVNGTKCIVVKHWAGIEAEIELLGVEKFSTGMGVSWKIDTPNDKDYIVTMFDYNGIGFRFYSDRDKLKEFGEYL